MNRKVLFVIVAVGLVLAMGLVVGARMTSPGGEVIDRNVIATGGDRGVTSSGQVLNGTVGQVVAGISDASNGTRLVHGFHVLVESGPGSTAARRWELY